MSATSRTCFGAPSVTQRIIAFPTSFSVSARKTEGDGVADGGPWSCSHGRARLALHASSIPAGEEARAAAAFGKACARLRDTAR